MAGPLAIGCETAHPKLQLWGGRGASRGGGADRLKRVQRWDVVGCGYEVGKLEKRQVQVSHSKQLRGRAWEWQHRGQCGVGCCGAAGGGWEAGGPRFAHPRNEWLNAIRRHVWGRGQGVGGGTKECKSADKGLSTSGRHTARDRAEGRVLIRATGTGRVAVRPIWAGNKEDKEGAN